MYVCKLYVCNVCMYVCMYGSVLTPQVHWRSLQPQLSWQCSCNALAVIDVSPHPSVQSTRRYLQRFSYICANVCMYVCMYVWISVRLNIHTYIHSYIVQTYHMFCQLFRPNVFVLAIIWTLHLNITCVRTFIYKSQLPTTDIENNSLPVA